MSALVVIAFVTGALGVWLTIKQSIYCWPVALASVIASCAEFYNERLYGDMALQVFYFFAGVYGWYFWHKNATQQFNVVKTPAAVAFILIFLSCAGTILFYFLLKRFNGDQPLLDGLLTACSLTATYMMTKKWVENWITWVVIDSAYVVLYLVKEMWLFAALYLLFTVIAFYGWIKWRRLVL